MFPKQCVLVCQYLNWEPSRGFSWIGYNIDTRTGLIFVSFPQKRNGIVFSSGVNYLHSGDNIQSE